MEDRGPQRQRCLRAALFHPVGRVRKSTQKCHPLWLLGMQRAGESFDAELFRDLPARFGGGFEHGHAASDLFAEFVLSLYPPSSEARGERAPPARVIFHPAPDPDLALTLFLSGKDQNYDQDQEQEQDQD